jgi:hypothetical protein
MACNSILHAWQRRLGVAHQCRRSIAPALGLRRKQIDAAGLLVIGRALRTRIARIDANGDAYIALDEVQDFYRLVLRSADRNSDGKVSLDEWLAAKAKE